jgi:hypothetical protein
MEQFDVFLAHNSLDKPQIIEIARHLKQKGLNPWLDKEQIRGGDKIIQAVFKGISLSKTGAFFIGQSGLGNFQASLELDTVIHSFLERQSQGFRVIPVLLPGVSDVPQELWYLKQWRWIQFTKSNDEEALDDLILSIKEQSTKTQAPQENDVIPPKPQPAQTDDLASEKGIDYTKLRDLLAAKNWKEADQETYQVMIQAVGKEYGNWFTSDELLNFPCTDLRTIDRLWVEYSNGHFGFSVQKEIYLSVGGKADGKYYKEAWGNFGDRVGWRVESSWIEYSEVTYDTSSPRGHLPIGLAYAARRNYRSYIFSSLASRLVKCNTP